MNIPTANVLVAFDKGVMDRLFSAGATYKSLVASLAAGEEDALLFDNTANPNFISFEHTLGAGNSMKMKLSFIDPKKEFERRFFTTNPSRLIEGFSYKPIGESKGFTTAKPDDVKQSQSEYEKEYVSEFTQQLSKNLGERVIYVAYGLGNNLDLWSGPHRTILTNANVDVKGSRKISLDLVPTAQDIDMTQRRGAYNEPANINLMGLSMRFAGESQEIKYKEVPGYDPTDYLQLSDRSSVRYERKRQSKALTQIGYEDLSKKIEKYDFHTIVVDALRSYIQKATNNPNVIVLLPNLNIVCRQAINDEARKYKILTGQEVVTFAPPGGRLSRIKDLFNATQTNLGREKNFVDSTLRAFGLRVHTEKKDTPLNREVIPSSEISKFSVNEYANDPEQAVNKFIDDRVFTAVIDKTKDMIPDHILVIKSILNRIQKMCKGSYVFSRVSAFTETDVNILKIWKEYSDKEFSYTFAGYDVFHPDREAIIVGDSAMIKDYLYANIDVKAVDKQAKSLRTKSKQFEKGSDEYNNLRFSANMQHPLHPLDLPILTALNYNKRIKEIAQPDINTDSAFGDLSYIPDEFSYKDSELSPDAAKLIKEKNIPVFRYNTQNPNVLDMKFKFGGVYFAALKTGYQKEISKLASAVANGSLPTGIGTFPITTRERAIEYLRMKQYSSGMGDDEQKEILKDLAGRLSPTLVEDLKESSPDRAADALAAVIKTAELDNKRGLILFDQHLPGNPNDTLADLSERMFRDGLQMSITTLPTFHLSRVASINTSCIVFAQDQPITQTQSPSTDLLNKFFSGLYKIIGFKHVIDSKSATSEFRLVKNAPKYKEES